MSFELWEIDLILPTKAKLFAYEQAMAAFGGVELDRSVSNSFKGRQAWRNSILILIKLPDGCRYKFIRQSRIWLHCKRVAVVPMWPQPKLIPLKGEHDLKKLNVRRSYNFDFGPMPWIKNYRPDMNGQTPGYELLKGSAVVRSVLDGKIENLLQF